MSPAVTRWVVQDRAETHSIKLTYSAAFDVGAIRAENTTVRFQLAGTTGATGSFVIAENTFRGSIRHVHL